VLGLAAGIALRLVAEATSAAPEAENRYEPWQTTVIYDAGGEVLARFFREDRRCVALEEIPRELRLAFVAMEDARFFRHRGVDLWALARALVRNTLRGRIVEGGSTITQQYVRHRHLSTERTLTRKLQEIHLALALEETLTKPEILERYLNEIYLGAGAYGVQAAARRYFGKPVEEVGLAEAALLAALPRAPEHYNPFTNPSGARARRNLVLERMQRLGHISRAEGQQAARSELGLADPVRSAGFAAHFVEHVRRELVDRFGADALYTGGLEVHTTLDRRKQGCAEAAAALAVHSGTIPTLSAASGRAEGATAPRADPGNDRGEAERSVGPELALVSLQAGSGAIRAMVGGRGTDAFNRAVQAIRQPGSAFKTFVYASAIQAGRHPGTVVNDLPMAAAQGEGWVVWPRNYDDTYRGLISYRTALNLSVNVAAVRVLQDLGVRRVATLVRRFGFSTLSERDGHAGHYALALGGLERGVSPLEMAAAYGVFANSGVRCEPHAIARVADRGGRLLYPVDAGGSGAAVEQPFAGGGGTPGHPHTAGCRRVLSEAQAYLVSDMLRTAVEEGTGWRAALDGPVAGKTGTSDDNTDAWFIGFADDLVTAVWIGEDRPAPMRYTREGGRWLRAAGEPQLALTGVHASWIWGRYMRQVLDGERERRTGAGADRRACPPGVVVAPIDPVTGLLAGDHTPITLSELILEEAPPCRETEFWSRIRTAWTHPESGPPVQRRYLEACRSLLGPAEIPLGGSDRVTTADGRVFRGVYRVGELEPIQKIDPATGLPLSQGEPVFETLPPGSSERHDGMPEPGQADPEVPPRG